MRARCSAAAPRRTATVEITSLAAGGDGVGLIAGKAVFVPLVAAGDVAEVAIVEERRTWCRALALRIVRPSPDRVDPPCPAFGACGGCAWQHVAYRAQLLAKRSIVENALRRIGHLAAPPAAETLPSPREYGYRHRANLHASGRGGAAALGFFRRASHEVVPIESCPVLHPALNTVLRAVRLTAAGRPGAFAHLALARLDAGWGGTAVRLTLRDAAGGNLACPRETAQALRETAAEAGVDLILGDDAARPLVLGPGDDALVTTSETFTQINLAQNPALVATTLELAGVVPGEHALDLCCGLGNLALPLAARGARVFGVDFDPEAVRQAGENAARLGGDARFVSADAAAAVRDLGGEGRRFGLVLLNPPRTGAREAAAALPALGPARVVMVSCDPATLARDGAALAAGGYRLDAVRPVDLFPQTAHVETVALFTRAGR